MRMRFLGKTGLQVSELCLGTGSFGGSSNYQIPGRDEGKFLRTSNLAFKPGTREGYITTSGEGGAWIYKLQGLAESLSLYSHQAVD